MSAIEPETTSDPVKLWHALTDKQWDLIRRRVIVIGVSKDGGMWAVAKGRTGHGRSPRQAVEALGI